MPSLWTLSGRGSTSFIRPEYSKIRAEPRQRDRRGGKLRLHRAPIQVLRRKAGWFYARYEATTKVPDPTPEEPDRTKEVPTFPNVLPMIKIASLCVDLGPIYSEMMLWNRLPPATMSRFADAWFERCLINGRGLAEKWRPEELDGRGKVRADTGVFEGSDTAGTIDGWKHKGYRAQWTVEDASHRVKRMATPPPARYCRRRWRGRTARPRRWCRSGRARPRPGRGRAWGRPSAARVGRRSS